MDGPLKDEKRVEDMAALLQAEFPFTYDQAKLVAGYIETQIESENRRYNETLLTRLLMRLGEAKGAMGDARAKLVSASVAMAVGIKMFWINRQLCRTQADVAKALGVGVETFRREVNKTREFLGIPKAIV